MLSLALNDVVHPRYVLFLWQVLMVNGVIDTISSICDWRNQQCFPHRTHISLHFYTYISCLSLSVHQGRYDLVRRPQWVSTGSDEYVNNCLISHVGIVGSLHFRMLYSRFPPCKHSMWNWPWNLNEVLGYDPGVWNSCTVHAVSRAYP